MPCFSELFYMLSFKRPRNSQQFQKAIILCVQTTLPQSPEEAPFLSKSAAGRRLQDVSTVSSEATVTLTAVAGGCDVQPKLRHLLLEDKHLEDNKTFTRQFIEHPRGKENYSTFIFKAESGSSTAKALHFHPLTKEDFQIILGVERFRCPEILQHPNWIRVEQLGLDEMAISFRTWASWNSDDQSKWHTLVHLEGLSKPRIRFSMNGMELLLMQLQCNYLSKRLVRWIIMKRVKIGLRTTKL
ncbi:unnamed protein product [Fraxinus pennsylvanica]|uniref:Uncharacterized protein n=1 Tax=Fraxinus pennsylvanica TaxID=56036 RepID=A0AAD1ZBN8_9LAMI|nr:unnamed protein product [Fraxinus pennsylvanica]